MRAFAVWIVLAALVAAGHDALASPTADIAEKLQGEDAECGFLLQLCRQASRVREQAELAAGRPGTETLNYRYEREAEMRTQEAVDAARVIRRKHPDKKPWCFDEPACGFLADEMRGTR